MKTTIASVAAMACVMLVASAAPRADLSAYQYGLTGNAWWAGQRHKPVAAIVPAPLQYGLVGNDWWSAQGHRDQRAN